MKKSYLLLCVLFLTYNTHCFSASLNSFTVSSTSANSTPISASFSIIRAITGSIYENVNWTVTIVLKDNNTGDQTIISTPITITNADFSGGAFCSKTINARIPLVKYRSPTLSGTTYNSTIMLLYSVNDYTSTPTPPVQSSSTYTAYNSLTYSNPNPSFNYGNLNTLYDGIGVAFPYAQYNTNIGWGVVQWDTEPSPPGVPNPNIGTIIDISDNNPTLIPGQAIYSPNGKYRLLLQLDGNLVLYQENNPGETGLWSTRTNGRTVGSLFFQTDANLVLYSGSVNGPPSASVWGSNQYDPGGSLTRFSSVSNVLAYPYYKLQNDGNLVLYWPYGWPVDSNPSTHATPVRIVMAATETGSSFPNPVSTHPTTLDIINHIIYNGGTRGVAYAYEFRIAY